MIKAKCYRCAWQADSESEETLVQLSKEHLKVVCDGLVLIVDLNGIVWPFPQTKMPLILYPEVIVESTGVRRLVV